MITMKNAAYLIWVSTTGPLCKKCDPDHTLRHESNCSCLNIDKDFWTKYRPKCIEVQTVILYPEEKNFSPW